MLPSRSGQAGGRDLPPDRPRCARLPAFGFRSPHEEREESTLPPPPCSTGSFRLLQDSPGRKPRGACPEKSIRAVDPVEERTLQSVAHYWKTLAGSALGRQRSADPDRLYIQEAAFCSPRLVRSHNVPLSLPFPLSHHAHPPADWLPRPNRRRTPLPGSDRGCHCRSFPLPSGESGLGKRPPRDDGPFSHD